MPAIALLGLAIAVLAPGSAIAGDWVYEGTASYSTGEYMFDEPTTTWLLWTTVGRTSGRLAIRASIPLVSQNTTLITTSGVGQVPTGGPMSGAVADSGGHGQGGMKAHARNPVPADPSTLTGYQTAIGDPVARISYEVRARARSSARLSASVKVPVADPSSFGTGEWDAGVSASWTQALGTSVVTDAEVYYWHLGDMADLDFQDPVGGVISVGRRIGNGWMLSLTGSGASASLQGYQAPGSIGLGAYRAGVSGGVGASFYFGLTETVPDVSFSLSWNRH